jgi:regulator of sigma E protease
VTTILAFLIVLGIVIFVHELGHFLAAKAVGVGVPRFSIGFGPLTPLRVVWGETEFVVSWIPLGGYVKMATREEEGGTSAIEGGDASNFPPEKLFENKPVWSRIIVLSAGVVMNGLLAWGIYTGLAASGRFGVDPVTTLAEVDTLAMPDDARELRHVPFGTRILRVNGDTAASWNDVLGGVMDPGPDQVRFDFAGGVPPVVIPISGSRISDRARLADALKPLRAPRVGIVSPNSRAAEAGLQTGDLIVRVNDDTVRYWDEMVRVVRSFPERALTLAVARGDSVRSVRATPAAEEERDPVSGARQTIGRLGIAPDIEVREVELTFPQAVATGGAQTIGVIRGVVATVKGLILGQVSPKELAGPIGIGQLAGQAARAGIITFVSLIAFISVNLAIFNLFPIPVLDGGHLLFLLIEGVRGKPVSTVIRLRLTQAGMALLLALVVLVMYNDVLRVFGVR